MTRILKFARISLLLIPAVCILFSLQHSPSVLLVKKGFTPFELNSLKRDVTGTSINGNVISVPAPTLTFLSNFQGCSGTGNVWKDVSSKFFCHAEYHGNTLLYDYFKKPFHPLRSHLAFKVLRI